MLVGVMLSPAVLQSSVLIMHAQVQPVSHTRSTAIDFEESVSLVKQTGRDGVELTHILLLCTVFSSVLFSVNVIVCKDMVLLWSLSSV